MALAAPMGQVYAVECDADACALVRQNQAKFAASNLTLIAGKAPEALQNLPAPDAVFIDVIRPALERAGLQPAGFQGQAACT